MNWLNRNAALFAGIGTMLLILLFAPLRSFPQILSPILFKTTSVPPPPLSGMLVWWSADVGSNCSGSVCTDGASQNTWADRSGNGNTGTLNFNPGITSPCVASVYHTNQINGKPALTFNGNTTEGSQTCFSVAGVSGGLNNQAASTAFFVGAYSGTGGGVRMAGNGRSLQWDGGSTGGGKLMRITNACVADIATDNAIGDTSWHQVNVTYNKTSGAYAFRIDRSADGSGTNIQSITSNWQVLGMTVCGGSFDTFNGQIAEFILYNRVLSGPEITTVETYLHSKYGL